MNIISFLRKLPIDLGQKEFRYKTKGSLISLEIAGEGNGKKALDAGCGDGFWSEKLKKAGWQVTSVDRVSNYKDSIKHNLDKELPFKDGSFDLVLSTAVIGYLNDPQRFIKEVRRVLKPEGPFIMTTPNCGFWLHYFLRIFGCSLKDVLDSDQRNFFCPKTIKALFPSERIMGYFPYFIFRFRISKLVNILSPTFIIVGKNKTPFKL